MLLVDDSVHLNEVTPEVVVPTMPAAPPCPYNYMTSRNYTWMLVINKDVTSHLQV